VSSRDFPGPSWQDSSAPDDGLPEYRPADANGYGRNGHGTGYDPGQAGYNQAQPPPGPAGPTRSHRRPASGDADRGNGGGYQGDRRYSEPRYDEPRYSEPRPGNGQYGDSGYPDPSYESGSRGSRSSRHGDPNRRGDPDKHGDPSRYSGQRRDSSGYDEPRRSDRGYQGYGNGSPRDADGYPANGYVANGGYNPDRMEPRSLDDSAAWFRPAGGYDSTGVGTTSRHSARPGYYTPDDDFTGIGEKIGSARHRSSRGSSREASRSEYAQGDPDELQWPQGRSGRRRGGADAGGPGGPGGPDDQDETKRPLIQRILLRIWRGNWWRRWTVKKAALLVGTLAALMVLVLVASFFVVLKATKVPLVALSATGDQSSLVYYSNGKVVGCFCTVDRTVLREDQVKHSKLLVAAVLAAEDRNFWKEGGVSLTGILRAAKNDLSSNSLQGGSTITEQFVKTYYDPSGLGNLTSSEKIKEIFVAIKLAKREPKIWILTHYLNAIPLGAGANGVQAAAETYFGVEPWQLTIGQAAMIAALIQSPYGYEATAPKYAPPGLPNSLLDRWIYVLTNMVRDGAITQAQMSVLVPDPADPNADFKNFPKVKIRPPDTTWPGYRGYIMSLVAGELETYYGYKNMAQIGNAGLHIRTTINQGMMKALYSAVNQNKQYMAELGVKLPPYVNISAVLEKPGTGKILAFYGGPGYNTPHCEKVNCKYNTILAAEPVGSSFKPYVLATAVSQGMNVQTSVMNSHSPLCIPPDYTYADQHELSKQTTNCDLLAGYWQFNEGGENTRGNLPVAGATASSNDPAFEDLIHRTTVQSVINMAQTLGVSTSDVAGLNALFGNDCRKKYPQCHPGAQNAALGEGSLTAVDQANTFSDFVSDGISVTPHVIDYIVESNGLKIPAHVVKTRALQPEVAGDVDYALSFDTSTDAPGGVAGTGVPNAVWDRPMIAKTGTLGNQDTAFAAWFVGAIPQYSMSVGLFTDRPNDPNQVLDVLPSIGSWTGGYGGAWPAHIWHTFMSENFSNLAVDQLPAQGYTGDDPDFTKWVMAPPPKKVKKKCKNQPGQGPGHHHHFFGNPNGSQGNCQTGPNPPPSSTPSPNPSQSSTPSPSPTPSSPTPTSPVITPTGSPSPSQSQQPPPFGGNGAKDDHQGKQKAPAPAADTADVTQLAMLPTEAYRITARPVSSGLVV
jgi:membrane peptidoglycan carboxypeptidase